MLPGAERPATAEAEGRSQEPEARSALGTYTHNLSTAGHHWFGLRDGRAVKVNRKDPKSRQEARDRSRGERWDLRRALRKVAESKRVQACGRPGAREDGSVVLRVTDATGTAAQHSTGANGRVAGFSGLFSCGNVWLCPVCSTRIAAERAKELETVLGHFLKSGGWAVLVTLTMRHRREHVS